MSSRNVLNAQEVARFVDDLAQQTASPELQRWLTGSARRWILKHYDLADRILCDPATGGFVLVRPDSVDDVPGRLRQVDARILHFVGAKPWHPAVSKRESRYRKVERIWHDHFLAYATADDVRRCFGARRRRLDELVASVRGGENDHPGGGSAAASATSDAVS